mgnify:CR=1 FL=1
MTDVCIEAKAVRDALFPFGWIYSGGGPYPASPTLHFYALDGSKLDVSLVVREDTKEGGS